MEKTTERPKLKAYVAALLVAVIFVGGLWASYNLGQAAEAKKAANALSTLQQEQAEAKEKLEKDHAERMKESEEENAKLQAELKEALASLDNCCSTSCTNSAPATVSKKRVPKARKATATTTKPRRKAKAANTKTAQAEKVSSEPVAADSVSTLKSLQPCQLEILPFEGVAIEAISYSPRPLSGWERLGPSKGGRRAAERYVAKNLEALEAQYGPIEGPYPFQ